MTKKRGTDRVVHRRAVQGRQRPRHPQADRADVCVRLGAEGSAAPAEDFRRGKELRVDFEPDNGFKHDWRIGDLLIW